MGHIRILMSARVILDLEKADKIYKEKGVKAYTDYMRCRGPYKKDFDAEVGGRRLEKGPMWHFAQACLKLNQAAGQPVVEIGLFCKDDQDTALPIFRNLDVSGLGDIEYRRATSGKELTKEDHASYKTDLFLTRNPKDSQLAIDLGIASATLTLPEKNYAYKRDDAKPVRVWVDGDAVAFGSSSEVRYRTEGLKVYREMEKHDFDKGIEAGPFTAILAKISELNEKFPKGEQPFEIALVTARGGDAAARVLTIASEHGIKFNGGMFFMGGATKADPLREHKPDLFLDDQYVHLKDACKYCATGLVAYKTGSPMFQYVEKQKAAEAAKAQQQQPPATPPAPPAPKI
jgi:5'-nucleotidase